MAIIIYGCGEKRALQPHDYSSGRSVFTLKHLNIKHLDKNRQSSAHQKNPFPGG
jgi:hypothetical protein